MLEDQIMPRDQKEFNDYIAKEVRELKQQLGDNTADTKEIVEIVRMGRGFFRVVATVGRWIRRILVWLTPIATGVYALWELAKELFKTKAGG